MRNNKIYEGIKKLLTEEQGEYVLTEIEIDKLAALTSVIVTSPANIREFFFLEATKIAIKIGSILKKQEEEIINKMSKKDGNGGGILN